jgi:hypothetical protein
MKNTRRALRRHHRLRMIARALRIYGRLRHSGWSEEEVLFRARHFHDHLQSCSCWMCGHRRKWFGPTIQERRWNQSGTDDEDGWEKDV